jgi:sterol desaturase/sphingolipid hydroxylase (fatty acid hydroxylase superfamily)
LSSVVRAAVIVVLGVPVATVVIFETVVTMAAMFHHSNIKLPRWFEKPLSYLIVTPSIHFMHHHALRADTDSNYATGLSVWDRIFGSRSKHERSLEMPMGVEGLSDVPLPRLILRPFWHI